MTILEDIVNLLGNEELTTAEIATKIDIPKNNCAVYLNTLYKDGRIERIDDGKYLKYKNSKNLLYLLKQLYNLMNVKMDFTKPAKNNDIELITKIEKVLEIE